MSGDFSVPSTGTRQDGKPSLAMIDRSDPNVHAEHPEHHTRKSHASLERDKPKHSGKVNARQHGVPRKHGHGKGNTGVLGEEYEDGDIELDPRDPDYEDDEEADKGGEKPEGVAEKAKEADSTTTGKDHAVGQSE